MKKIRICLEIEGLSEDENGNPCPGGLFVTLGEDTDPEPTAEEYLPELPDCPMSVDVRWWSAELAPESEV